MQNGSASKGIFNQYPRIWISFAGFIGTYGVLAGLFDAAFWPDALSERDSLIALPIALLVAGAFACLVWYHLVQNLPAWPIAGGVIDDKQLPPIVRSAIFVLIAYIGLVFGEGVTILLYAKEGPFSQSFEGMIAYNPLDKPLLPLWTWPLAFAGGAGVMHWLCWSALNPMRKSGKGGEAAG
jgi:hypothetical protein